MFEQLQEFKRIFVTGPHRSGTRICAQMIEHDTGHRYVDETEVWDSWVGVDAFTAWHPDGIVVQAPLLALTLPDHVQAGDLVVWMERPYADILQSMRRIDMTGDAVTSELCAWIRQYPESVLTMRMDDAPEEVLLSLKLKVARHLRSACLHNGASLQMQSYESLAAHPLWIPRAHRRDWEWNQTQPEAAA